eukprot:1158958-Pelagomonas_calceolata.AAC.8
MSPLHLALDEPSSARWSGATRLQQVATKASASILTTAHHVGFGVHPSGQSDANKRHCRGTGRGIPTRGIVERQEGAFQQEALSRGRKGRNLTLL